MSHTSGPWTIDRSFRTAINANGGKKHVAMVNFYKCPDEDAMVDEAEHEANVLLIAAAPDLLEACKAVREQLEIAGSLAGWVEGPNPFCRAMRLANEAITKATEDNDAS